MRLVAVVLVVATVTGLSASRHADETAVRTARVDALRLASLAQAEPEMDRALLYAVQGVRLESSPATRAALLSVLSRSPQLIGVEHVAPESVGPMRNGIVSNDGRLSVSITSNYTVSVWNTTSGRRVEALHGHAADIRTAEFSPDGSTLRTTDRGGTVLIWDLRGDRRFAARTPLASPPVGVRTTLVPRPDGQAVIAVAVRPEDGVRVLNLIGGIRGAPFARRQTGRVTPVWRPDGGRIATADSEGFLRTWDPATGAPLAAHHSMAGTRASIAYTPDGLTILMASRAGMLYRVDAETLELIGSPVPVGGQIGGVVAGPGGRLAAVLTGSATSEDGRMTRYAVVDLDDGSVLRRGSLAFDANAMAFAPGGRHLAVTGEMGEVVVLDLRSGISVRPTVIGHNGSVASVAYSPDGTRIVTGGFDGRVALWHADTGQRLGSMRPGNGGAPSRPLFLPDGHTVLIPADDGTVARWDARPAQWLEFACRVAGRDLTADEWDRALDGRPYRETC